MGDEWAYLDEVNVIALWPADQKAAVTSTKWSERRDGLQSLLDLCEKHPRLDAKTTTIYGEVVDELKKILIKDSNVNVVVVAIRVVEALARGLRRSFGGFVGMVWTPLLEKAKDKKATVKEALGPALDAVAASTASLDRLSPALFEAMQKPSPEAKILLDSFVYRLLKTIPSASAALPFLKELTPVLVKHAGEGDASVREAALLALGGVRRLLGPALDGLLGGLKTEQPKMAKIAAACEAATAEVAEEAAARGAGAEREAAPATNGDGASASDADADATRAVADEAIDPWTLLDPVDIPAALPKTFQEGLTSKKWSDRKEALECLETLLKEKCRAVASPETNALIQQLVKMIDKDVNINVGAVSASCVALFARALRTEFAPLTAKTLAVCFDRLKEKKPVLRDRIVECMDAVALTAAIDAFSEEIIAGLSKPNPACRSAVASFVMRLLLQHTTATLPTDAVRSVAPALVKLSSDSDADCRQEAFGALAALLRCVGDRVGKTLLGELAEDKLKMGKIEEKRDELVKECPMEASEGIRRLHGQGTAAKKIVNGAPSAPARKPMPPSSGPRPATTSASTRRPPAAVRVVAAPATARPAVAKAPTPAAAAPTTASKRASLGPSTQRAPSLTRVAGTPRASSSIRQPTTATGRSTPMHRGSRENLNGTGGGPPTVEGARFVNEDGKEARLAENRPSTVGDLVKLASGACSPQLVALLRSDELAGQMMVCEALEKLPPSSVSANSDLFIRWLALRLPLGAPSLVTRLLPLAARLLDGAQLADPELALVMPALLAKVADSKDTVRGDAKALVAAIAENVGAPRVVAFLADSLRAKSFRQRLDTLEILLGLLARDSALLRATGQNTNKRLFSALFDCVAERDALVRTAALNTVVVVDRQLKDEDDAYRAALAKLSAKERATVDERLARAASAPAPRPLAALPRPTVSSGIRPPSSGLPRPPAATSRLPRPGSGIPALGKK